MPHIARSHIIALDANKELRKAGASSAGQVRMYTLRRLSNTLVPLVFTVHLCSAVFT
jgi:hypothetical protein